MKTAPAASHSERATTLASLPLQLQLGLLEFHSLGLDVDWLQSALDDGHFDVTAEDGQQFALQKFSATSQFLTGTVPVSMRTDPEFGQMDWPCVHLVAMPSLENAKNEGFRPFFVGLVAHVVEQVQRLQDMWPDRATEGSQDHAVWGGFDQAINAAFAKAMVACVALDLPESVRKLAEAQPAAMNVYLKVPETLGEGAMKWDRTAFAHGEPAELTPYAMAMAFSNTKSMEALVDAGFDVGSIAKCVRDDPRTNPMQVDVIDIMDFWRLAPVMGLPTAIRTALEHRQGIVKDAEHDPFNLALLATESFDTRAGANSVGHYRDAFHAVGAFEVNPRLTLSSAIQAGHAEEIQRLKGKVEWQSFESFAGHETSHFVMKAMANAISNTSTKENYENALIAVIERAAADGKFDFALGSIPVKTNEPVDFFKSEKHDVVRMQPAAMIIGNDFSRAIAKMMDQGLDVKRPLAEGALPLLEYAEQQGAKNVVVTMRAHLARTAAHSLLDEMDNEPTKAAPR